LANPQAEDRNPITFRKRKLLCITAKSAADRQLWVTNCRATSLNARQ
jgi:hypothetical protein